MARCSKKKGIWVVKQCENAAFTNCNICYKPFCTEHLSVDSQKKFVCVDCLQNSFPDYVIEDYYQGDIENYIYFLASLKPRFDELEAKAKELGIKIIPIEKLYNFNRYDLISFRQEFIQYYDDNDTSANLYDS